MWLTPWSRVLPQNITGRQLVNKLRALCGTRWFITAPTTVRHLYPNLGQISPVHPSPLHFFKTRLYIILPSRHRSSKWSSSHWFPHRNRVCTFPVSHTCYKPRPSHSSRIDHPNNVCKHRSQTSSLCTVWVSVCVGFVMCGCFGNMCTCIYCVFVLFRLCIFILFMLLFNFVSYIFFVMFMYYCYVCYVLYILFSSYQLALFAYPDRVFRAFSSVVRQMPGYNSQWRGTARTLPKLTVLFGVLFVCKCVLYYCHRVSSQLQLTHISI